MANDSQNLMALLGSMTPQQLRALEGVIKKTRTSGMNIFEKARKQAIDAFFAAKKIWYDTEVNPDYHYEYQEYPKILYCVVETVDGPQLVDQMFEGEDETEGYGPEWCANPGLAQKYYAASQGETPEPAPQKRGPGRPRRTEGEYSHA